MRTVLVCGGRCYNDRLFVYNTLNDIHKNEPIGILIQGGANGADLLASDWANQEEIDCIRVPAKWSKEGRGAGPRRNERMLKKYDPDLVVAFPGGKGTKNMIRLAEENNTPVMRLH